MQFTHLISAIGFGYIIAVDSKGNIYTGETYRGQRVQKFVYKGLAPVTKKDQGVVWPTKTNTH